MRMLFKSLWRMALLGLCFSLSGGEKLELYAEPVDGNIMAWKDYRRMFHSIYGSPGNLTFCFSIPKDSDAMIKNASLTVLVPAGVKVEEVLPQYVLRSGLHEAFDLKYMVADGPEGKAYRFPELDSFLDTNRGLNYAKVHEISFYFEPEQFDPDKEYILRYCWENDGKSNGEKHVILKFLPPLEKKKLPDHFSLLNFVQLWNLNVKNPALLEKIVRNYQFSGLDGKALERKGNRNLETEKKLRAYGWRFHAPIFFSPLTLSKSWLDGLKVKPALLYNGKESGRVYCPSDALKNRELLQKSLEINFGNYDIHNGDRLSLDIEPFGYWNDACFCSECLDQFASEFHIDRKNLTSPEVVRTKYEEMWLSHCIDIQTKLIRYHVEYFKQKYPGSKVGIYDYILDFETPEKLKESLKGCPLDPRKMESFTDVHEPSLYSTSGKQLIMELQRQKRHLKRNVGGTVSFDHSIGVAGSYLTASYTQTPSGMRLQLLSIAALGGDSAMIYTGRYLDGKVFENVSRAMHEIAVFEPFFRSGESTLLKAYLDPEWDRRHEDDFLSDSFAVVTNQLDGRILATVFNFNKQTPLKSRFEYKDVLSSFYVSNRSSGILYMLDGEKLWNPEKFNRFFSITVQPEDAAFVEISREAPFAPGTSVTGCNIRADGNPISKTEPGLENRLDRERNHWMERLSSPPSDAAHHGSGIRFKDQLIYVQTATQEVIVSYDSGLIVFWKDRKKNKILLPRIDTASYHFGEGLGWSLVHSPLSSREHFLNNHRRFSPVEAVITDEGRILVFMGYLHPDFFLGKTFDFSASAPEITLTCQMTNLTEYSMKFSLRSRFCFPAVPSGVLLDEKPVPLKEGNNFFPPPETASSSGLVSLSAVFPNLSVKLLWNAKLMESLLLWQGKNITTLELISKEKQIRPLQLNSLSCRLTAN